MSNLFIKSNKYPKQRTGRDVEKRVLDPYFGGEILEDSCEVDRSSSTDALGVLPGLEEPRNSSNGELEPGLAAPRRRLLRRSGADSFSSSGHGRIRTLGLGFRSGGEGEKGGKLGIVAGETKFRCLLWFVSL